jgi:hypothetical protein
MCLNFKFFMLVSYYLSYFVISIFTNQINNVQSKRKDY